MSRLNKAALVLFLSVAVVCSGCALFDSVLGYKEVPTQVFAEDGSPLYVAPDGSTTKDAIDKATGVANPVKTVLLLDTNSKPGSQAMLESLANLIPGWGALIGALATAGSLIYAKWRNGQRLAEQGLKVAAQDELDLSKALNKFVIMLVEKIKTGTADVFQDGKLDQVKLKAWLKLQGAEFTDPAYLAEVVRQVTKAL